MPSARFYQSKQRLVLEVVDMVRASTSAAGVRFLSSIKEGRGLKRSAREAGVHQEVGYRWLRESYLNYRRNGVPAADAEALLGFSSARSVVWEAEVGHSERHHLRVDVDIEKVFWNAYESGSDLTAAARSAGVGRSTAYRWLERRFGELRTAGMSQRQTQRLLRLSDLVTAQAEQRREDQIQTQRREALIGRREALRSSRQFADVAAGPAPSEATQRRAARDDAYWQLMRSGETNASASRLLGMHRRTGTNIRRAQQHQTRPPARLAVSCGRYLDLRERLEISDLLRLGFSLRSVADQLGRHPSTVKRELDRHRDHDGRYLPRTADHDARAQRARPRPTKLVANSGLRRLVQRKLNRCWSPDEICGWMKKTYPGDSSMRLCPETIYRELLLRGNTSLHKSIATSCGPAVGSGSPGGSPAVDTAPPWATRR
jgi:transposase